MSQSVSIFPDQFRLNGRTALITGSARGLGWEIAQGLAQAGARVLLHGRSAERLAPRLATLHGAGFAADALTFDMADRTAMRQAMATAGPIDILVHNVGERDRRPFAEIEPEDFARLIDVDLPSLSFPKRQVVSHLDALEAAAQKLLNRQASPIFGRYHYFFGVQ